jgi:nucleotide-binding universal stress UspA family protein
MVIINRILVATDFSEPSGAALAYGRDLARAYGAQLHLLCVVQDVATRMAPEAGAALATLQQDVEKAARRNLDARLTEDDLTRLRAVAAVAVNRDAADGICRYARDHGIDLIITGTHGRGAIKHLMLGSVAERVVRLAGCPVLTVHAHERDFIVPDAISVAAGV